jgi:methanogenic corrinoid protein MtbC1
MRNGDLSKGLDREGAGDEHGCEYEGELDACKPIPAAVSEAELRMARLIRAIEGEIVPRLVLSRRVGKFAEVVPVREARSPDASDVSELVRLLLHHEVSVASAYVETVRQRGATLEMICLELLAPAARELGVMWEEDECDFMQVTVGLCRLHQLLRELSPEFSVAHVERPGDRRILLATCPGDQHTFGIALVAQFLRRAGWDVWHEFLATSAEILEVSSQHWFSVIGLSVATETRIDVLSETIRSIRRASRNRAVGIMVGGPVLIERPELAALVGADATAIDGAQAVLRAEHMFTRSSPTH